MWAVWTLLIFSLYFILFNHPMMMLISILFTSCFLSFFIFKITHMVWFSYILILTFSGGLLVIFIYIVSLVPNNSLLSIPLKSMIFFLLMYFFMFLILSSNFIDMNILNVSIMYNISSQFILIIAIMILIFMLIISFFSFNPFNPLKSFN